MLTNTKHDNSAPSVCGFPTVSAVLKVCEGLRTFRADHSHWSFDERLRTRPTKRGHVKKSDAELAADAEEYMNALMRSL
jgi:hypothetical protein